MSETGTWIRRCILTHKGVKGELPRISHCTKQRKARLPVLQEPSFQHHHRQEVQYAKYPYEWKMNNEDAKKHEGVKSEN